MISVIVPVHNTLLYIDECIRSILSQTYSNLEIICVDSSTDGTTDLLLKLKETDSRLHIVLDSNSSYGYKVNMGMRQAHGEYISIIDSDDYIEPEMYQCLLNALLENDADFVKSDHSLFQVIDGENVFVEYIANLSESSLYSKCIDCRRDVSILYKTGISIWTGLYKKSFLQDNNIYLNESEGASFQDAGFSVLTHVYARRAYYLPGSFYWYRTDNIASSVKSQKKYRTIVDEWEFIERQIAKRGFSDVSLIKALRMRKIINYEWNMLRLDDKASKEFSISVHEQLESQYLESDIIEDMPSWFWDMFQKVYENGRPIKPVMQQELKEEWEENLYSGLISWINFEDLSEILLLGKARKYEKFFKEKNCKIYEISLESIFEASFREKHLSTFDYVVGIEALEMVIPPGHLLDIVKEVLKPHGKFFLGTDNRMGLRYLCGETDPYTKRRFDGLDNYNTYKWDTGKMCLTEKCYTKAELKKFLTDAGFRIKFYSVFPTLENPQLIISEDYHPAERVSGRYIPMYRNPDSVLFYEEPICDDFAQNNALHLVANAYWVECTLDDCFMDVSQVTLSIERGKENAFATLIHPQEVEKKALFEQGKDNLKKLAENMRQLQERGIATVSSRVQGETFVMPYVDAVLGDMYLRNLLRTDLDKFLDRMDYFRELILQSSEHVRKNESKVILRNGYVDMVPLNSFYQDGDFVFFDQEFCMHNYPADAILYRAIVIVYERFPEGEALISKEDLLERYGMKSQWEWLHQITTDFIYQLRRREEMAKFYNAHMRNDDVVRLNRRWLNDLDRLECQPNSCFDGLKGKKLFLFGAGKWCDKFLAFYKDEYDICCILDNNESRWGSEIQGIPVNSPDILIGERSDYKVIICTKNYSQIFRQLKLMQVTNIGRYDANYFYPGRQTLNLLPSANGDKKYRIGYLSGTFDLFHIGHLNILKRAKEQCEYLIAAVTSDEYVRSRKNKEPIIPFEERMEVVKSCKYVDEVVGVPVHYAGTVEAFQKYHFDCQFCGSDCANNTWWLEQKVFLQAHGSDLVFLPYTEQTSSTKIRALINKGLL